MRVKKALQVSDGGSGVEGRLRDLGDLISVEREDPQVGQAPEGALLHALKLVVADDERGQAGQVGEHEGRQDRYLVVAQVAERIIFK